MNNAVAYEFATHEISKPFSEGFEANNIRTISEGLSEALPDGEIFVEEQKYGGLLKMNMAGDISRQYVFRVDDGRVSVVNWSRYLDKRLPRKTASSAAKHCNG